MDPITQQTALAAAGAAGEEALYVDDVFSTYLYDGTGSAETITNGIDLLNEGGLVWRKNRSDVSGQSHFLHDTERSPQSGMPTSHRLSSDNPNQQFSDNDYITSWNSDGFTYSTGNPGLSASGEEVVSWSFRKAPGFFDVVTYTGTGSVQNISHNLGSVPGMIIVKEFSNSGESWGVYHRSLAASQTLLLNTTDPAFTSTNSWNSTAPTSSVFTVGTETRVNASGETYVAYLFAHDDAQFGTAGDEAIIKCDQYVGAGSGTVKEVDLGFEPQWLMIKKTDGAENWLIFDNMRGVSSNGNDAHLVPNEPDAEVSNADRINFTSTGFNLNVGNMTNESGKSFMYVAIRRPNKPPTAGTDVFSMSTSGSNVEYSAGFAPDFALTKSRNGSVGYTGTRLTGNNIYHNVQSTGGDSSFTDGWYFDLETGNFKQRQVSSDPITYHFKRGSKFFDVVAYTGDSTARMQPHNLGVVPELIIVKSRATGGWYVYAEPLGNQGSVRLDSDAGANTGSAIWNSTSPTSSAFSLPGWGYNNNHAGDNYVALLFASLNGVSKVGEYTGANADVTVNCGFSGAPRFLLIKRTDGGGTYNGDWYVWDSTRGINPSTANPSEDPYFLLNTNDAQVTNTDYLEPTTSGFTVKSGAPADLNGGSNIPGGPGKYLYLAIA